MNRKGKRPEKRQKMAPNALDLSTDEEEEQERQREIQAARRKQQRKRTKNPPVYATDARIPAPLEPGITFTDEELEERIAFCCMLCNCPDDVKATFVNDEYITPATHPDMDKRVLWHRRCCHRAAEVTTGWLSSHDFALTSAGNSLTQKSNLEGPLSETQAHVPAKDVWKHYVTQKKQESELYNDDELEEQFSLLDTNESYERNRKHFHKKRKEIQAQGHVLREAVVVDLFGGIGSGLVCLKRLGIAIKTVVHVDHDKIANFVYKHNHADDGIQHVIIEKFEDFEEQVDQLSDKYGPFNIVIGGPPCIDYTKVNANSKGVAGKQGSYMLRMGEIVNRLHYRAKTHQAPFFFLAENAAMYDWDTEKPLKETDLEIIKRSFGVDWSLRFDSREHSPLRRNRTYISNIPFQGDIGARDIPPRTCFDKGCTENCLSTCECGRYDVAGNIFEPDMIARAQGLMASKGRLDDSRMYIYLENRSRKGRLIFYRRTPTVVERERLLGLPEGYVKNPVDNLFTALLQDGLDMYWEKHAPVGAICNNWRCSLNKKYWEFAGDYPGFQGHYFPFQYYFDKEVVKLMLAPPLTTKHPQFYTAEEYGKRLLGNTFSIPTVVMLLQPICDFFQHRKYPTFTYNYAWDKFETDSYDASPSERVAEMMKAADEERFMKRRATHATTQLHKTKPTPDDRNESIKTLGKTRIRNIKEKANGSTKDRADMNPTNYNDKLHLTAATVAGERAGILVEEEFDPYAAWDI